MKEKKLKIAYLSSEDPMNKRVWSGTHYSIFKSLSTFSEVRVIGPFQPGVQILIGRIINQLSLILLGKRFDYRHSFLISKAYGKYFTRKIQDLNPDLIVAPAASCEIAFLETNVPIIYITDGTFEVCLNYHKALTNLLNFNISQGNEIEKLAIQKSKYVIVSSEWAANSTKNYYRKEEEKVKVIPFGANLENLPDALQINNQKPKEWKLLFVGVYWKSKGGDIAFNAFTKLCDEGFPVSLTVLGCLPPKEFSHPKLNVIPFIDKNSSEGQKQMIEIYSQHHFMILPTRFDCTPIAINEASAFGILCLVSETGGVAGHLKNNENGFLIPYSDSGEKYYQKIKEQILSPEKYFELRLRSRKIYEEQLNWNKWTEKMKVLIFS